MIRTRSDVTNRSWSVQHFADVFSQCSYASDLAHSLFYLSFVVFFLCTPALLLAPSLPRSCPSTRCSARPTTLVASTTCGGGKTWKMVYKHHHTKDCAMMVNSSWRTPPIPANLATCPDSQTAVHPARVRASPIHYVSFSLSCLLCGTSFWHMLS